MATYVVAPSALAAAILTYGNDNPATTADQTIFEVTGGTFAGALDLRSLSGGWLIPCIIRAADPNNKPIFTSTGAAQAVRMDSTMRVTAAGMPTFEDIVWSGWTAASNGVLYTNSQPITVRRCDFIGNTARTCIKSIRGTASKPGVVDSCTFTTSGQAVARGSDYTTITNCRAVLPTGVIFDAGTFTTSTVVAHNSVYATLNGSGTLFGGAGAYHANIGINAGSGATLGILGGTYSSNILYGTFTTSASGTDGGSNQFGTNPLLTDAANGDFTALGLSSPGVRAVARSGDLLLDATGASRSDPTDIGALELYLEISTYTGEDADPPSYWVDGLGQPVDGSPPWDPLPSGTGSEQTLERLVFVSLFSDARLSDDETPPDGSDDRRGWWDDTYTGDNTGSRLWALFARAGVTPREIEDAVREALAWMLTRGLCTEVNVLAEIQAGIVRCAIDLVQQNGTVPIIYTDLWSPYYAS